MDFAGKRCGWSSDIHCSLWLGNLYLDACNGFKFGHSDFPFYIFVYTFIFHKVYCFWVEPLGKPTYDFLSDFCRYLLLISLFLLLFFLCYCGVCFVLGFYWLIWKLAWICDDKGSFLRLHEASCDFSLFSFFLFCFLLLFCFSFVFVDGFFSVSLCVCVCVCVCVCMHMCVHTCAHMCVCACVCVRVCIKAGLLYDRFFNHLICVPDVCYIMINLTWVACEFVRTMRTEYVEETSEREISLKSNIFLLKCVTDFQQFYTKF